MDKFEQGGQVDKFEHLNIKFGSSLNLRNNEENIVWENIAGEQALSVLLIFSCSFRFWYSQSVSY